MRNFLHGIWLPLAAAGGAMGLVVVGLALGGFPAFEVLGEWVRGAMSTRAEWAAGLQEACPLLLTGLAAGVAFRSGVLNIGAEGQFTLGALAVTAMTTRWILPGPGWWVVSVAIFAGCLAGGAWALVAGALERWRGVPVVLSTILLNFVALYLAGVLLSGPLQARGSHAPQSPELAEAYQLPVMMVNTQLHVGVLLAMAAAAVVWVVQARTVAGYETLLTGVNPVAAALAGVPVGRRRLGVIFFSGALAGLGGGLEVTGVTHFMTETPFGYGYAGIAVAMLGRLHPLGIAAAAMFFGMLDTGARFVEKGDLEVPHAVADIVKGVVVLAMLVGTAWLARRRLRGNDGMMIEGTRDRGKAPPPLTPSALPPLNPVTPLPVEGGG